jgi:hypothetical protein
MPLRYSKDRLKILKSVAALQQRGALDKDLYREFLRWYGKALRQLQRLGDERPLRRGPSELTKSWANRLASPDFMAGGCEFHPERDVPVLTPEAEALLTLLTDHGSDAYNKLVRGAKIGPLF